LYEAGCDDALFGVRDGAQYGAFDREANSFSEALASAIRDVTSAVAGLQVVRIEPDELVTMAAIAKRSGLSREYIRLLSTNQRGPGGFPARLRSHGLWINHGLRGCWPIRADMRNRRLRSQIATSNERWGPQRVADAIARETNDEYSLEDSLLNDLVEAIETNDQVLARKAPLFNRALTYFVLAILVELGERTVQ